MPVKYIPYVPNTIEGQAVLDNVTRTRRVLRYRENGRVYDRIQRGLPLYEVDKIETIGKPSGNLLIHGECLSACGYLKDKGIEVDLVYIDPPFASGADYAKKVYLRRHPSKAQQIAKHEEKVELAIQKGEEIDFDELRAFEEKMYGDIWNKESYLNWMYENLTAIKSIMRSTGSIYLHIDWRIGHYVKILMDEVFGEGNFRNNIIWAYFGFKRATTRKYPQKHDDIFFYVKDEDQYVWNLQFRPHSEEYKSRFKEDEEGRFYRDDVKGDIIESFWSDIPPVNPVAEERADYNTQKPEALLKRIIEASSDKGMVVADFFGGSGTTAKVAHDLGRTFVSVDVGLNSFQTSRDRLRQAGAAFQILNISDGVSLFRNPAQTMEKLKTLVKGLKNEDSLDKFWEGAIHDSKLGMMPVFIPNLLDHTTKVLDAPLMNRVLREALPDLPDGVKQAIVYYVDIDDRKALDKFIKSENPTDIKIELRDLKRVLDEVVLNDIVKYKESKTKGGYEVEINRFVSDRLQQKIDEYNQKKGLSEKRTLFDSENGEENDEDSEENAKPSKKAKFKPIEISDDGLELIELVSLDCTAKKGRWHADSEIKIDKKGFVILNGKKTKDFWDAKVPSKKKPLRLKVRNIAGDESVIELSH